MTNQTNLYTHPEAKPEEKSLRRWQEIAEELSKTTDSVKIRELGQELVRAMDREMGRQR
jgi:hypothetical protein